VKKVPEGVGLHDPQAALPGLGEHPAGADWRPRLPGGRAVQLDQQHPMPVPRGYSLVRYSGR
jgi:hypothetical protein